MRSGVVVWAAWVGNSPAQVGTNNPALLGTPLVNKNTQVRCAANNTLKDALKKHLGLFYMTFCLNGTDAKAIISSWGHPKTT